MRRSIWALCALLLMADCAGASVRFYVKADGSGDASSWENAGSLAEVLAGKASGDAEVWVAGGTYSLSQTLELKKGVKLYGGFAGDETSLAARDLSLTSNATTNASVLDGQQVRRVLTCRGANGDPGASPNSADTCLDGFTIMSGNAATSGGGKGGGMFCENAGPTVANCVFTRNNAASGGGMYNENANPVVINCTFVNNQATQNGGGMYNVNSDPAIINCTFAENQGIGSAGGIYNQAANPVILNCTFVSNLTGANGYGGGIRNTSGSMPSILNAIFHENRKLGSSGGLNSIFGNVNVLRNCVFPSGSVSGTPVVSEDNVADNVSLTAVSVNGSTLYYELPENSRARGAGLPVGTSIPMGGAIPSDDLRGYIRPFGTRVDVGAWDSRAKAPELRVKAAPSSSDVRAGETVTFSIAAEYGSWELDPPHVWSVPPAQIGILSHDLTLNGAALDCQWTDGVLSVTPGSAGTLELSAVFAWKGRRAGVENVRVSVEPVVNDPIQTETPLSVKGGAVVVSSSAGPVAMAEPGATLILAAGPWVDASGRPVSVTGMRVIAGGRERSDATARPDGNIALSVGTEDAEYDVRVEGQASDGTWLISRSIHVVVGRGYLTASLAAPESAAVGARVVFELGAWCYRGAPASVSTPVWTLNGQEVTASVDVVSPDCSRLAVTPETAGTLRVTVACSLAGEPSVRGIESADVRVFVPASTPGPTPGIPVVDVPDGPAVPIVPDVPVIPVVPDAPEPGSSQDVPPGDRESAGGGCSAAGHVPLAVLMAGAAAFLMKK